MQRLMRWWGHWLSRTRHALASTLATSKKTDACKAINEEVMPRHLNNLEKLLESSPTGWVAGTELPSIADFVWGCALAHYIPDKDRIFNEELRKLDAYPSCQALAAKFMALPEVKAYYSKSGLA
mmetsp:Transcript_34360/g.69535  ORF Transcript_34360/g.69535 Transcript_34360/m.69535 type:complete len:124 (+) Transcript_34360:250-621(+)